MTYAANTEEKGENFSRMTGRDRLKSEPALHP
jgi:hypothetical protein